MTASYHRDAGRQPTVDGLVWRTAAPTRRFSAQWADLTLNGTALISTNASQFERATYGTTPCSAARDCGRHAVRLGDVASSVLNIVAPGLYSTLLPTPLLQVTGRFLRADVIVTCNCSGAECGLCVRRSRSDRTDAGQPNVRRIPVVGVAIDHDATAGRPFLRRTGRSDMFSGRVHLTARSSNGPSFR